MSRWFWFGLITSAGYLISNQFLRLALHLHPSAAAALSALVGTSLALLLVRSFTSFTLRTAQLAATVLPVRQRQSDPTPPPIGLGLAGTPVPKSNGGKVSAGNGKAAGSLIQELMGLGFHPAVDEFKRRLLCQTIANCGGNRAEAARRLGLQRTYLYRLTKQLNCGEPSRRDVEDQLSA